MDVGLMPLITVKTSKAIVGRNMSDIIIKQGAFKQAANELLQDKLFKLN